MRPLSSLPSSASRASYRASRANRLARLTSQTVRQAVQQTVRLSQRLKTLLSALFCVALCVLFTGQIHAATYYYQTGNPNTPGNWDTFVGGGGTDATNFTTNGDIFIIPNGRTATLTADLAFGMGANAVTLSVLSGATLNVGTFAVQLAGNNSAFNLLGGGTLQTARADGINGPDNLTGSIQLTAPAPATVAVNYAATANYIFGGASVVAVTATRFLDPSGNKQVITQAANITVLTMGAGGELWSDAGVTLSGDITVQNNANIQLFGTLTLTNAGSTIQTGGELLFNGNGRLANGGFLTVQNNARVTVYNPLLPAIVTGTAINYLTGSTLQYLTTSSARTTGLELPTTMNGNIYIGPTTTGPISLGAATTLNGSIFVDNVFVTSAANMLTVANFAAGAVAQSGAGEIRGPMRRALPPGTSTGTWLFPVSKGGAYMPFAIVNPNTSGVSTIEVEAFNAASGGTTDGVTISGALDPYYWRVAEVSGSFFSSGFARVGRAGLAATDRIGSSATQTGSYVSTGVNTFTAGTPPTLQRTITDPLTVPTFYAVASTALPITTFYYQAGNPNNPANWNSLLAGGGTPAVATDFTTAGNTFIIPTGRTATLTNNRVFGAGANNVTLTVQNGGVLDIPDPFQVRFAGDNSVFNLQAGATLRTSKGDGINGNADANGAIAKTATGPVTLNYNVGARYIFNGAGGFCNFAAIGAKPAITQAAGMTIAGTSGAWEMAHPITITGGLFDHQNTGSSFFLSNILTLNGAGHIINGFCALNSPGQVVINAVGGCTVQSNGIFRLNAITMPVVSGNAMSYAAGGQLVYATSPALTAGLEWPATMNGNITTTSAGDITLGAARTLSATGTIGIGTVLITSAANMLTVNNTTAGAVGYVGTGRVLGPLRRLLPDGGGAGAWQFPVGVGANQLPFSIVNPAAGSSSPLIEVQAFAGPFGGTADGTTLVAGSLSTTEYWRARLISGTFSTGLMQAAKTGIAAPTVIGSSATSNGMYASSGANTYPGGIPPAARRTVAETVTGAGTFFALGTEAPSVFYFQSGNPNTPANWDSNIGGGGTDATAADFTSTGKLFIIPNGGTAALTANLAFSAGVSLAVASGGTLNTLGFAITGAGSFQLQAGGTLQTSRTDGVNGASVATGAIQVTGGATYNNAANYWFDDPSAAANLNFAAQGAKAAITQANNITITSPGPGTAIWTLATPLIIGGALNMTRSQLNCAAGVSSMLTLNGASTFNTQGGLRVGANFQVNNLGTMTVNANTFLRIAPTTAFPIPFTGNSPIYVDNTTILSYAHNVPITTGAELPSTMPGELALNGSAALTLATGTTTITGILNPGSTFSSPLNTGSGNMLRIDAVAGGGILGSQGLINGPVQLNLPVGTYSGAWIPVSKGGTPLWASVDFTAPSGGLIEIEAYNTGSGGSADATSVTTVNATEHWRFTQLSGMPMTVTPTFVTAAGAGAAKAIASSTTLGGTYTANGPAAYSAFGFYGIPYNQATVPIPLSAATTYFTLGNGIPTYYYNNANVFAGGANNPQNWDTAPGAAYGTPAPNFTTAGTAFSIDAGSTAVLTADLPFGMGANNVTLTVPSGATLNTQTFAVQFAGNNSRFNLQNGATFATQNVDGINGTSDITGTVQITGGATGVSISYGATANFTMGAVTGTLPMRIFGSGGKPTITQMGNLILNATGANGWNIAEPLTVNGTLTVQSGVLRVSGDIVTLAGTGHTVQNGAMLRFAGGQVVNAVAGALTIQSGGEVEMGPGAVAASIQNNAPVYASGSILRYNSTPALNTGLELPASMNGDVVVNTPNTMTLAAATTLNGSLTMQNGVFATSAANMLTVGNTASGAVTRTGGMVDGPMRRALPAGGPTVGTWLFPVGKGTTYLPFAVTNPTTAGGAVVEAEAFTVSSGGSTDGTTITGTLGAEYWAASVASGTFTSGFMQVGKTGLTAANLIGSSTTLAGTYSSNGANTFNGVPTPSTLTRTVANNLAAPTYFAVGTAAATYYYFSGDPSVSTNWWTNIGGTGTQAANFTTAGSTFVVPNTYTTAVPTANITIGAGVTLNVASGGTLNVGGFAVAGAGNFDLQAGGTLQANNATGFDGSAITTTGRTWSPAANYIFQPTPPLGTDRNINIATAQVNNLTTLAGGTAFINSNLQVNGMLSAASRMSMCGTTFTLAGAGPHSLTNEIWVGGGTLTVSAGSTLNVSGVAGMVSLVGPFGCGMTGSITGTGTINYAAGTWLVYGGGWTGTSSQPSLPTVMGGGIWMNGATVTLGAATTVNSLQLFGGNITTSAVNTLTVGNTAVGAVTGGSTTSFVNGPLRRALPAGASIGQWLFPVGKGGNYYPFTINTPTTGAGGATVGIEAFNVASGGGVDGTTLGGPLGTEYWQGQVTGGSFTSGLMQVGRTGLTAGNLIGSSLTQIGTYTSSGVNTFAAGTPPTLTQTVGTGVTFFAVGTTIAVTTMNVQNNAPPFGIPPVTPSFNSMNAAPTTNITIPFSDNLNPATVTAPNFRVQGSMRGLRTATYGVAPANTATLTGITSSFLPNEQVWVSVTNAQSTGGTSTRPFVMGFRTAAGAGPANFSASVAGSPFAAGTNPRSVTFGDIDGDGDLDLATANQGSNNVTVRLNDGTGAFTATSPGSPFVVGGAARFLAFGDVDSDGDLDLAIARIGASSVVVLLNNGSGTYTPAVGSPFATGTGPWSVTFGDVDGDGDLDLATANFGSNNVTVLLNNGAGTFAPAVGSPFAVGTGPSTAAFGDVDGDGDLDLATANSGTNNVTVLLNNGAGQYAPAVGSPFAAGTNPRSVTFGDIDGDGDLDLAIPNQFSNNITVLLNNGVGSYTAALGSPFAVGTQPISANFGDIDGDGDLDLATANQGSNDVTVLLNNGSGAFTPTANSPFAVGTQPNSVAFGDIDGDGDLDLATANNGSNNVSVLLNAAPLTATATAPARNGNSTTNSGMSAHNALGTAAVQTTFSAGPLTAATGRVFGTQSWQNPLPAPTLAGAVATLTAPNAWKAGERVTTTMMTANTASASLAAPFVWDYQVRTAATSPGAFYQMENVVTGFGTAITGSVLADFDGDGNLDAASMGSGANNVYVARGLGNGNFAAVQAFPLGAGTPYRLTAGDFNNDGRPDVAVIMQPASNARVILNTSPAPGTVSFGAGLAVATGLGGGGAQGSFITTGDMNGDGNLDLIATEFIGTDRVSVMLGNGAGAFAATTFLSGTGDTFGCATADFDGDGDLDIAVANRAGAPSLSIFLNSGNGTTYARTDYGTGQGTNVGLGDFDLDGDVDIALTLLAGSVQIFTNNGTGAFVAGASYATGATPRSCVVQDVNGDGDLDLLVGADSGPITLLTGVGGATFTAPVTYTPAVAPLYFAIGDLDNDGDVDMVTRHTGGNQLAAFMNAPSTYYYVSGDASNPANWNSVLGGGGSPAPSFLTPVFTPAATTLTFIVPSGLTAAAAANFVLGAGVSMAVQNNGTLSIGNGVTMTNNSALLNIQAGGRLQLVGGGAVTTTPVNYAAATSVLEYAGAAANTSTTIELPGPMPASVIINNTGGVTLHANRQINGALTMQGGTFNIAGQTLQPNAAITFSGGIINGNATSALAITGAGAITGGALFSGVLGGLTMNRAAATLALGSPLMMAGAGTLTLTQGYVQTTPANILAVPNTATITGGSAASHIAGSLRLDLPTGGGTYAYPVGGGTAGTYLPVTLNYTSTAAGTSLDLEAVAAGSGGTAGTLMAGGSLSTTEYWRVNPTATVNNATLTFQRTTPALVPGTLGSILGSSATSNGTYNGITSTVAVPTIQNTTPFATLVAGSRFYAIGTALPPSVRAGFGNALHFTPAINRYVDAGNNASFNTPTALTVEATVNFAGVSGLYNIIAAKWDFAPNLSWHVGINPAGKLEVLVSDNGTNIIPIMTEVASFPVGAWQHIAFTLNATTGQCFLYRNGVVVASGTLGFSPIFTTTIPVTIGGRPTGTIVSFNGDIDEVRLWGVALPQSQINVFKGLEISATHPNWSNLRGYWRFNEYSGATAFDSKGTNHGTLVGGPSVTASAASVSMIANVNVGVSTALTLPATAYTAPTFSLVPPTSTNGIVTPATGNPVHYTPTNLIALNSTDSFGYQATDGITTDNSTVTVRYAPRLTGGSQTVTAGFPTALAFPTLNGGTSVSMPVVAPFVWQWSPATNLSSASVQNPVFTGSSPQTYTVTVTDAYGLTASASVQVNIGTAGIPSVVSTTPARNLSIAPVTSNLAVEFSAPMLPSVASANVMKVWGGLTGYRSTGGVFQQPAPTQVQFTPASPARVGEQIWVTVTNAQNTSMIPVRPYVYGFHTRVNAGTATFVETVRVAGMGTVVKQIVGDFNNDGATDVVVAQGSSVGVYFNTRTTSLLPSTPIMINAGLNVVNMFGADVNNDGLLDIVAASDAGPAVKVLLNNGSGSFNTGLAPVSLSSLLAFAKAKGSEPASTTAIGFVEGTDLNADGLFDVVVAMTGANKLVPLLNTGSGVLVPSAALSVGLNGPTQPIVGDFDDDGDIDIGAVGSSGVTLYANDGTGNFATTPAASIGAGNARAFVADFNGDGRLDIATTSNGAPTTLTMLRNDGSWSFSALQTLDVGGQQFDLTGGDWDSDGDIDLVITGLPFAQRQVYLNSGAGMFTLQTLPAPRSGGILAVGTDVSGDGAMDLVVTNTDGSVSIETNALQLVLLGTFPPRNTNSGDRLVPVQHTFNQGLASITWNGPNFRIYGSMTGRISGAAGGSSNIATISAGTRRPGEYVMVSVTNAQALSFASMTRATVYGFRTEAGVGPARIVLSTTLSVGVGPRGVCAVDVNLDTYVDIVSADRQSNTVTVLRNIANRFDAAATLSTDAAPQAVIAADLNSDGYAEIITANGTGTATLSVFRNNSTTAGSVNFAPAVTVTSTLAGAPSPTNALWAGDVNGDGWLDVVMISQTANAASVFLNDRAGNLNEVATFAVPSPRAVTGGDVDSDGDMDVITTGTDGKVRVWANMFANFTPAPQYPFTQALTLDVVLPATAVSCVDMNGDGNLDLVAAVGGVAQIFTGNGRGGFSTMPTASSLALANVRDLAVGDMNGDGALEFVATDAAAGRATLTATPFSPMQTAAGTTNATLTALSPVAIVLADLDNDGDLDAITANEANNSISLLYNQNVPQISVIGPLFGPPGTQVRITGMDFIGTTGVTFGDIPVTMYTVISPTEILVTVPPNAPAGPVTVTTVGGSTTSTLSFTPVIAPTITNVGPSVVAAGTTVTITGTLLDGATTVLFGGVPTTEFRVISPTQIEVIVPTNAKTGPVTVVTPTLSPRSPTPIVVVNTPTITTVGPPFVPTGGVIQVTGTDFLSVTSVTIGGVPITTFRVISPTELELIAPPDVVSGPIVITNIAGPGRSDSSITVGPPPRITGFTFDGASTISTMNPNGTFTSSSVATITITGVNFTGATSVTIGGVPVRSFTIAPDGQTITVTASTTATGVVTIATPFGEASTTIPYSYGVSSLGNTSDPRVPAILNFTPTSGSRGQRVRVFGRNLVNLSQVRFGGVPVQSFTQISTTEIVCVVSTGATGRIEATTALGVARSLRNFTFTTNGTLADVVITDFVPKFGATGATMTIVGENFLNVSNVRIGGVDVQSFVVNSTTEITAVVGTGANGLVSLEASLGQASSIEPFTFIDNYVDNDSVALAKFYLIANGVAWARSDGWYSLTPLDQWHGVTVQIINGERRAVRLELPDNGIASYYPRVLRRLDELRVLNLSGNSISPAPAPQMSAGQMMGSGGSVAGSGSDGSSSGSLPRWIGNYSKLEELRLSDAQLSGAVPDSVWALSNLRVIDLQRNNLMGSVGDGICSMSELRELLLSNNRITGTLPECIANVVNLTTLDIGSNRLGGQLPSGLAQIATLKVLRAGNNSFTGSLPPFGQNAPAAKVVRGVAKTAANDTPTGLEILDVGTNRIAGEIPASLGNLRSLTTLMLNNNSFTGQIPPTLWNAQSLRSAYLHSNRLAGELDESIATAQQVQILRLDSNRLTGAVPEAVARLVRLRHLALGSNRFVSVPDLTNIGRLDTLRVEDNALTFESLEPNRATPVFTYSPQDSVGLGGTRVGVLGKPLIIDGTVGGENNRYRWYKRSWTRSGTGANAVWSFQENVMVEQTNAELRVNAFSRADTGTYFCHITNPTTPALTLYMRPVRISSFTIPPPPPGAPELIYPVRSAKNIPMFTPLEWRPVEDEYVYEWQVARDSTFANASIIAQGIVAETSANVTNLQHLSRYWWRVRAVNEGGIGLWSETIVTTTGAITSRNHRWFEVVSPDVKLAFPTVDFGRTARTVTTTTPARVINVSNVPLVLTNVVAVDAEGNFSIVSSTATLQPSQTLRLQASFTPKTIGYKQGNATLSFRETRAGVPLQMQAVSEAFRGRSAALDLQRVDFDTVLVGRNAFSTAVVINRDVQPIRILNARIMPSKLYPTPSHQGIFAVEPIEEGGVVLGSGDTTALIFRCKTPGVGRFFDRYEVQADIDTAQSDTRAASRKQRPGDVVIGGGVSADTSNVPPGSPVTLTMYIFSGNARQLYAATQPEFTAVLRFDRNLLALDAAQGSKAYLVRNSAGTRTARMVLPLRWDGRDTIIARVPCVAVQGDTDRTRIQIEQLNWGSQNLALTSVGLGANRVFVDSLRDGIFMSDLCKAGGKRLVRQTTAVGLVASRPNPTSDQATIAYSLRTSGMTEIQLLDLNGKLITTLLRGMQEAGEHELVLDAGKLPSGVYMIVLTTPTARLTERLEVVK